MKLIDVNELDKMQDDDIAKYLDSKYKTLYKMLDAYLPFVSSTEFIIRDKLENHEMYKQMYNTMSIDYTNHLNSLKHLVIDLICLRTGLSLNKCDIIYGYIEEDRHVMDGEAIYNLLYLIKLINTLKEDDINEWPKIN